MELKDKKKGLAADSTNETALSGNDVAGREAALSFSGEDMTKAAAKRHALVLSIPAQNCELCIVKRLI